MNDIEHTNRQIHNTGNFMEATNETRRFQRQLTNPNAETHTHTAGGNQSTSNDTQNTGLSTSKHSTIVALTLSTAPKPSTVVTTPGAGNSNSLPGHQSGRTKHGGQLLDQQALNLSDSFNTSSNVGDHNANSSPPSSALSRKKNLSTSDLDPFERKKQAALTKVEAKLDKAQRLHQKAQQNVEQEISDFLRATTIPNTNNEATSCRTTNATFDKRIRTLQDTKKELEKKIANYQSDISRIQAGEIPYNYASSKDILSNIRSTAVKVASGSLKVRSLHNTDQASTISTSSANEQVPSFYHPESDYHNPNISITLLTPSPQPTTLPTAITSGSTNNNQNLSVQNQFSGTFEPSYSSVSSSASNEIGNSQFYIDANYDHVYDSDKSNRKHDTNIPVDGSTLLDNDKSPTNKRHFTDDSTVENNDRISDHSVDDRCVSTTSKRNTPTTTTTTTTVECQQLNTKLDSMQKLIERYESKMSEMQKQIDLLVSSNEAQGELNERLNNELTDLTDLHQIEMSSMKTDLKNLEDRLLYKFNDYWNELLEKLDKLDTRTAKVEQTQTHSLETEENTHRIISKLVNIVLTVFAIILLLLSTIKNLVQSRVHAMTVLVLVIVWITFHYLPPNYFQTSFLKNFPNSLKRAS
ncbi:unnamed protein product [Rotaria magnacalcarata]|uniref:Uncharacterized protein n=1 Tax=Rotaria magnacalcarata TaxID=392030 RepID=A0A816UE83_9BILA|nr:unnamed protein product [Rotaria magnacalcarata]